MSNAIIGIDYSISSPSVCACVLDNGEFLLSNCKFVYGTDKKVFLGSFSNGMFTGHETISSKHENVDRFMRLASISQSLIVQYKEHNLDIAIEDYAFSRAGQLTTLGENGGILKAAIKARFNEYVKPYSSTTIKKFARECFPVELQKDSKGKLIKMDKEQMHEAFKYDTGVNLCLIFGVDSVLTQSGAITKGNPITDIVDSYFVAKYHHNQLLKKGKL